MQPSSASNIPSTEAAPGLTLADGRYRLIRQLGRGGYGRVWLAEDSVLGVEVAVKEVAIPAGTTAVTAAEMIERATLEARNAARLRDHPNIVTVHDVLVERGVPWTVMQYVPGRSLADEIDLNGPVPVPTAQRVAAAMLSALSACHEAGVVHRDVKPHNIMLAEDGTPMLTDFGIAKAMGQATMTEEGMVVGSVAYIAPERAKGQQATSASDLFSLGVTLYHAVEGTSPFDRGSGMATLAAVLLDDLPEPGRGGLLTPVVQGLTAKDPTRRLTAEQAVVLLDGQSTATAPTVPLTEERKPSGGGSPTRSETAVIDHAVRPRQPMGRHAVLALTALGATLVALLVGGLGWLVRGDAVAVWEYLGGGLKIGVVVDAVLVGALCARAVQVMRASSGRVVGVAGFLLGAGVTSLTLLAVLVAISDIERLPGLPPSALSVPDGSQAVVYGVLLLTVFLVASWAWTARRSRHRRGKGPASHRPSRRAVLVTDAVAAVCALLAWTLWPAPQPPAPPLTAQVGTLTGPTTVDSVYGVEFSPDGRNLATVYDDGTVQVWDVATRRQIGQLLGPFGSWGIDVDVAFSEDGRTLTTTKVNGQYCVLQSWDVATGRQTGELIVDLPTDDHLYDPINTAVLSPDGRVLAVTPDEDASDLSVQLWDVVGGRRIGSIGSTSDMGPGVKLSPDGRVAVTIWEDPDQGAELSLWDVAGQDPIGNVITLPGSEDFEEYEFSPDGRLLVTASSPQDGSESTTVRLWDVSTQNQVRQPITIPYQVSEVALDSHGHTLAADGRALGLWNVDTGQQVGVHTEGDALAFSPDGRILAVGGDHGSLLLLKVPNG